MASIIQRNSAIRSNLNLTNSFNTNQVKNFSPKTGLLNYKGLRTGVPISLNFKPNYSNFVKGPTLNPNSFTVKAEINSPSGSNPQPSSSSAQSASSTSNSIKTANDASTFPTTGPIQTSDSTPNPPNSVDQKSLDDIKPFEDDSGSNSIVKDLISDLPDTIEQAATDASALNPAILPFFAVNSIGEAAASTYSSSIRSNINDEILSNSMNPDSGVRFATESQLSNQLNDLNNDEGLMKSFSFLGPLNLMFSSGDSFQPPQINDTGSISND